MKTGLSLDFNAVISLVESARAERLAPRIAPLRTVAAATPAKSIDLSEIIKGKQVSRRNGLLTFVTKRQQKQLPSGIWYMGGVSRNALRELLGLPQFPVRDIDLVAIGRFHADQLLHLSQIVSPEDTAFSHGIETLNSRKAYFTSRDFSCNQILFNGDRLVCTERAAEALLSGSIELVSIQPTPLLLMKALRLVVVEGNRETSVRLLEACRGIEISKFAFNLQLDRSGPYRKDLKRIAEELGVTVMGDRGKAATH